MKRTRPLLVLLTTLPTLVAAGVGYFLVARTSPGAAFSRALVDAGLLVFLLAAVLTLTQGPTQLVQRLTQALRGLSIGQRDKRLDPERFGDLADVARAYNEVAAALSEGDDPNLGEVKSRPRSRQEADRKEREAAAHEERDKPVPMAAKAEPAASPRRKQQLDEISEHPDVGPVRKMRRPPQAKEDEPKKAEPEEAEPERDEAEESGAPGTEEADKGEPPAREADKSEPPVEAEDNAPPAESEPPAESSAEAEEADVQPRGDPSQPPILAVHDAPTLRPTEDEEGERRADTAVDESGSPDREGEGDDGAQATIPEAAAPAGGSDDELRALFDEFVEAKAANDEPTIDLHWESFAKTLRQESGRLRDEHGCRDVRFEVRLQNGEVSLLPRLLR